MHAILSLVSRQRDYQLYPVTLAVLQKAYFVCDWTDQWLQLNLLKGGRGREDRYHQIYPISYWWKLLDWKKDLQNTDKGYRLS